MKRNVFRSLFMRMYISILQKKYKDLKYVLKKGKSDTLIISFSGFPGNGVARYNYIRTLKNCNAHQLFILDDFGYKKRGSYYLGEDGNWFIPQQLEELVKHIQSKTNTKRLITIGSSKGGTAALYYGIKLYGDACVIGAPQYWLGDYLNTDKHSAILRGIMGNCDESSVKKLNELMKECIHSGDRKLQVYIHYSPNEHTYPEHIKDMIAELSSNGYRISEDADYDYENHTDVAKYFPAYLLHILKNELK